MASDYLAGEAARTLGLRQEDAVIVRYGEVFLKKGNRRAFLDALGANLRQSLGDLPWRIRAVHGRFLALPLPPTPPEEGGRAVAAMTLEEVLERLQRVFGVSSISPALRSEPSVEALRESAVALMERPRAGAGTTFRVTARRTDKRLPFTSDHLAREVGAAVVERLGLRVDLHRPDRVLGVEAGSDRDHTFVFVESRQGPGGLPVGVSGRAVLLLSGGIDSPVAGYLAMKRGLALEAVYFHSHPYTGESSREKVVDLLRVLSLFGGPKRLHLVPFTAFQEAVRDHCPPRLAVVLYRRMMMRIACAVARRTRGHALVTGESLGQVASQTLENLGCIEAASDLPVLRPLLTYDKEETVALARRIGTFPISVRPFSDCCSLFVPSHPVTRCRLDDVERAEGALDLDALCREAVEGIEVWPL